jgi:uncharacterized membrane protein (UPF0127 family)
VKRCLITLSLVVATAMLWGCKPSTATTPVAGPALPTSAQPRLPTMKLYLGAQEMIAEVARTEQQQECGMMFRTSMGSNEGMIFLLPQAMRASFWMKNCPLPLSAAYIDSDGTIEEIHALQPQDTNAVMASANNIHYVLEAPQGWFQKNGVTAGAVIRTEKGSLAETFSGTE